MSQFQELSGKWRTNSSTIPQPTSELLQKKYTQHYMSMGSLANYGAYDNLVQTFRLLVLDQQARLLSLPSNSAAWSFSPKNRYFAEAGSMEGIAASGDIHVVKHVAIFQNLESNSSHFHTVFHLGTQLPTSSALTEIAMGCHLPFLTTKICQACSDSPPPHGCAVWCTRTYKCRGHNIHCPCKLSVCNTKQSMHLLCLQVHSRTSAPLFTMRYTLYKRYNNAQNLWHFQRSTEELRSAGSPDTLLAQLPCWSRVSYSKCPRTESRQVLSISEDGNSTPSLGNLLGS